MDDNLRFLNAAREGNLAIIKQFLTEGKIKIDKRDEDERTAFHWACAQGHLDVASDLLKAGAEIDVEDEEGWTPLLSTSSSGHTQIVRLLLSNSNKLDINHRNNSGRSSLHYACSKGYLEIAQLLIEHGANVNIKDKYGGTPLHRAASNSKSKFSENIVVLLLEKQALINIQDSNGDTPLHIACSENNRKVAEKLILQGAEVLDNKDGKIPFELCQERSVAEALIDLAKKNKK